MPLGLKRSLLYVFAPCLRPVLGFLRQIVPAARPNLITSFRDYAETITETPRSEVDSDLSGRFAPLELMMPLGYPAKKHRHPQVGLQALKDKV